jgi:CRP-like cAMP-binding protein
MGQIHPECAFCKSTNNPLLNSCALSELSDISKSKDVYYFKKGDVIVQEGASPHGLICVNEGALKEYKISTTGHEKIIKLSSKGDIIGCNMMFGQEAHDANIAALTDCTICIIPHSMILELFYTNKKLAVNLARYFSVYYNQLREDLLEVSYMPVLNRIAHSILIIDEKLNCKGNVHISRNDLASLAGTIRETTSRSLNKLAEMKIISLGSKNIKIEDIKKLKALANNVTL